MIETTATVYLVDDDPFVRHALSLLLKRAGWRVAAFASAEDFLDRYDPVNGGCLILDVHMPGLNGLELHQQLNELDCHLPVIFLSGHGDIPMSVRAIKAGAFDFLTKPVPGQELLAIVEDAVQLDRESRREAARKAAILERYRRLTPREQEVMGRMVTGRSSKEIARLLGVSYRTVEIHRSRVLEKMEARSLPDLIAQALIGGILDLNKGPHP
ncbi:response regulator transcription factor [Marinobacterium aestuariivivens]|uniref:Response regulator transcription factor n=1 Tax=Marinobacterium aestuariivivens TaxID=1698799 RepID=A0ABW2A0R4_9GAMM